MKHWNGLSLSDIETLIWCRYCFWDSYGLIPICIYSLFADEQVKSGAKTKFHTFSIWAIQINFAWDLNPHKWLLTVLQYCMSLHISVKQTANMILLITIFIVLCTPDLSTQRLLNIWGDHIWRSQRGPPGGENSYASSSGRGRSTYDLKLREIPVVMCEL